MAGCDELDTATIMRSFWRIVIMSSLLFRRFQGCTDVDDALSVRWLDNGSIEVGVHIADVTHFVRQVLALSGCFSVRQGGSRSSLKQGTSVLPSTRGGALICGSEASIHKSTVHPTSLKPACASCCGSLLLQKLRQLSRWRKE